MKSLSAYGAGPKIGLVTLPYLIISVTLTVLYPVIFTFPVSAKPATLFVGVLLLLVGSAELSSLQSSSSFPSFNDDPISGFVASGAFY